MDTYIWALIINVFKGSPRHVQSRFLYFLVVHLSCLGWSGWVMTTVSLRSCEVSWGPCAGSLHEYFSLLPPDFTSTLCPHACLHIHLTWLFPFHRGREAERNEQSDRIAPDPRANLKEKKKSPSKIHSRSRAWKKSAVWGRASPCGQHILGFLWQK